MPLLDELMKCRRAGFSVADIATALGKHRSTVSLWFKNGVPPRLDGQSLAQLYSLVRAVQLGYQLGALPLSARGCTDRPEVLRTLMRQLNQKGTDK